MSHSEEEGLLPWVLCPQPDRGFMKKLKSMDRKLDCTFNRVNERFVITYARATGEPAIIFGVAIKEDFRQPDERDLNFLASGDLTRSSMRNSMERTAKYMEDYRAEHDRKRKENLRDLTKDGKNQLVPRLARMSGGGKGNSTFRRVTPKQKGLTAAQIINNASGGV